MRILTAQPEFQVGVDEGRESFECAICCNTDADYVDNDGYRALPCGHYFHASCMDGICARYTSCPTCMLGF